MKIKNKFLIVASLSFVTVLSFNGQVANAAAAASSSLGSAIAIVPAPAPVRAPIDSAISLESGGRPIVPVLPSAIVPAPVRAPIDSAISLGSGGRPIVPVLPSAIVPGSVIDVIKPLPTLTNISLVDSFYAETLNESAEYIKFINAHADELITKLAKSDSAKKLEIIQARDISKKYFTFLMHNFKEKQKAYHKAFITSGRVKAEAIFSQMKADNVKLKNGYKGLLKGIKTKSFDIKELAKKHQPISSGTNSGMGSIKSASESGAVSQK